MGERETASKRPIVWHVCSGSYIDADPYARETRWRKPGAKKPGRPKKTAAGEDGQR